MNVADLFPTRFIAAADLNGKSFTLTIRSVTLEDMQSHDNKTVTKPVAWFSNAAKGLVLNRTNCMIIADLHGPETDAWAGKQIVIYATKVRAFGKMEDAIRVRAQGAPELPSPGGAQPKPVAAPVEEPADFDDDGTDSLDITIDPDTGEIRNADTSLWEPHPEGSRKPKAPDGITPPQLLRLTKLMAQLYGADWGRLEPKLAQDASTGTVNQFSHLKVKEAEVLLRQLEASIKHGANGKVHA